MNTFDSLARLWWVRAPALLGRVSSLLARLASDGAYLRAWPIAAALAPIGCLLFGVLAGATHFADRTALSFTNSLFLMALFVLFSGLSGGLGIWMVLGYILGDFVLFGQRGYYNEFFNELFGVRLALPIAYILLGKLVSLTPVVSRGLRLQVLGRLRLPGLAGTIGHAALQGIMQAGLVWVWVQATPTLIRPLYTWRGGTPTYDAMAPLQEHGVWLVALALLMGIARVIVERRPAAQRAAAGAQIELTAAMAGARSLRSLAMPVWLGSALRSALATYMLAGLLMTPGEAILFFGLTFGGQMLRGLVATRLAPLSRTMARVPVVLRLVAGGLISFLVASALVPLVWNSNQTFFPIMIPVATSMVVFALLMPASDIPRAAPQSTDKIGGAGMPGALGKSEVETVVLR